MAVRRTRHARALAILLSSAALTVPAGLLVEGPVVAGAGPIMAIGSTLDQSGRGAEATVILRAWPRQDILAKLQDGDDVQVGTVGRTTSSADGSFDLRLDPDAPIEEFMERDGTVNFEVMAHGKDGTSLWSFPRRFVGDAKDGAWISVEGAGQDVETRPESVNLVLGGQGDGGPDGVKMPEAASDKICITSVVLTYNQNLGLVGEVYTGPNANATLIYDELSSSTLGIGTSSSGTFGSYTASGTSTHSSTFEVTFPKVLAGGRKVFQSSWQYKKYILTCPWVAGYEVRPSAFQGGQWQYNAASTPSATNCTPYLAGGSVTKKTATAMTFSNGLKIGDEIGIDLSSRTGFDTNTKITFSFFDDGQLCGSNDFPPDAKRVVAK